MLEISQRTQLVRRATWRQKQLVSHNFNLPCTVPHDSFNISKNSDRLKIRRCNGKQWRPWSDCSSRSSLIWVCTVCLDMFVRKIRFIILDHMAKSNYLWICTCKTLRKTWQKYFWNFSLSKGQPSQSISLPPANLTCVGQVGNCLFLTLHLIFYHKFSPFYDSLYIGISHLLFLLAVTGHMLITFANSLDPD